MDGDSDDDKSPSGPIGRPPPSWIPPPGPPSPRQPPAPKPALDVYDRLPGGALGLRDPTHAQEEDAERMQAAFVHQGAWHHLIVGEMARQEPVIGADIRFRYDTADPIAPSYHILSKDVCSFPN